MSAETLRRAATEIREDWPSHWVASHHLSVVTDTKFHRAVADWLDSVALSVDKRDNPEHVGGQHKGLRIPDEFAALNVARAYLGGAA